MSAAKLLSRIVAPTSTDAFRNSQTSQDGSDDMSYGISSDPLGQFGIVFAALIHDVDHPGVPNAVLVAEQTELAIKYSDTRSVAEHHSIATAWGILRRDEYRELRQAIYSTPVEHERFRTLVVQAVLATDIADQHCTARRNARWEHAFGTPAEPVRPEQCDAIRQARKMIVIEHLIQASDVAHTMQHWHVYRKWNERYFRECYQAYCTGRTNIDPSIGWYEGELGFFDFYIIPLAKKLKECGVFGVSSDEYLNYAVQNRNEWLARGTEMVATMVTAVESGRISV